MPFSKGIRSSITERLRCFIRLLFGPCEYYAKQLISNFEAENKETPEQLEPEPQNGVAYKIKNV